MRLFKYRKLGIIITVIIMIGYFLYIDNNSIEVSEVNIYKNNIPNTFNGYTIVQISDLHNKKFGDHQAEILNKIKNESPNIIVVTGDLVDVNHTDVEAAMEFISGAVKIAPVYYVTGNHEALIKKYKKIYLPDKVEQSGATVLKNTCVNIKLNNDSINLYGIDDPSMSLSFSDNNHEIVENTLSNIHLDKSQFNILLSHRPELIDLYDKYGYDLVFTGHAHGGQFRVPFIGLGIYAPAQGFFPKYTSGLHSYGNTLQIVSRGLGNSSIPIRIFNRPELIVCKLRCA